MGGECLYDQLGYPVYRPKISFYVGSDVDDSYVVYAVKAGSCMCKLVVRSIINVLFLSMPRGVQLREEKEAIRLLEGKDDSRYYRVGSYIEIWAKPWGGFRPETKPLGRLSCTQTEGGSDAKGEDENPSGRRSSMAKLDLSIWLSYWRLCVSNKRFKYWGCL